MKEFITSYLKKFESDTLHYIKANIIALVIILSAVVALTVWILPNEKQVDETEYSVNSEIAKNTDLHTMEYVDAKLGLKQDKKLAEVKAVKKQNLFFHFVAFIPILGIAVVFLAMLMQAIYTKIQFTKNLLAGMRILSATLYCSTLIVIVVFALWYIKTYFLIA
ncbi:MAG: hypothetical protein UR18_C0006G0011 [Candidatus Nomurabacteria bacterium GW2011_GWE2_31_40]|nr:MAG: hypothetical protein UR18_C0006G0011 [Candidatus Nomurabacteria bacterium GW2011_GWE2_31_40]OGV06213.1 MAG: hypothetical protein A2299_12305 [Stygiobacter sp. RIFOXYB2_FULL_37_11]OGV15963.1 MAG: hypothetical protein A2440_03235 [Stygiobacter sp. RIFOXYC2_FULL_38_25]OGV27907.1 MAG: hypothetical protein A2499_17340 [Stygiobacter sp. RIFOXYC12_FULL_38_8]OGV80440.1 MAG: hypothetical protein A2X65_04395 [Stygiobacter sp. GWF2_38_21]